MRNLVRSTFACSTMLIAALCPSLVAADLCVNRAHNSGCYAKIAEAVSAASPYDIIRVSPGEYDEQVTISKPLSLIGSGYYRTSIDAAGQSNGIYINGLDNPGLKHVVVKGFKVERARFEGILITNATAVTIAENHVVNNDRNLNFSSHVCPGLPNFETAEDDDCGEGIHLVGVDHSIISENVVERNAGGILLSDETGSTHHNLITKNTVRDNPFDCGITLASHPPAPFAGTAPLGIHHNTISGNHSLRNGANGDGAGVGIFGFLPNAMNYSNVVVRNTVIGNTLPGVTIHSHSPGARFDDNLIVGNRISRNGADNEDAETPGPTGINAFGASPLTGTVIAQNVIDHEAVSVAVRTPATVEVHLNTFLDDTIGVDNLGDGDVDATENWWACPAGPGGGQGCATVGGPRVTAVPFSTTPF